LRPFIPQVSDPPDVVKTKLASFVREYEDMLKDQYSAFGPSSGYRQLAPMEEILRSPGGRSGAAPAGGDMPLVQDPADARRLPPGTRFRTPDGRVLEVPRQ
jgi:hypothetical protein